MPRAPMRCSSRSIALLVALGLCLSGCRRDKDAAPGPTSGAPSGAAPDPTGSVGAADPTSSGEAEAPPPPGGPTLVDLAGVAHPPAPIADGAPRLGSTSMLTEVRQKPHPGATKVGYLRAGAVVEMEPGEHGNAGCPGGWRKIKPFGFVCVGPEATLDLQHPIVRALTRRPDFTHKLPYMYGIATHDGPVYGRIPTAEQQKDHEPNLKKHLAKWVKDKESGATYGLDVWLKWRADKDAVPSALDAMESRTTDAEIPWFLKDGQVVPNLSGKVKAKDAVKIDDFSHHNGVAFVESFLSEGRRYNVSTDLRVLPADRFRPIRGSEFHGFEIGKDIDFPFALVRKKGAKKYRFDGKKMVAAGEVEWRSAVKLTGKQKMGGSRLYYETPDGFYVEDRSAGRVEPAKKMPGWGKKGEKWIDINLTKQVLVAYEGEKPVYATLVSSGEAGLGDPDKSKSTKRGIFRVHTKYLSITMDSEVVGEEFELRDVPYVQFFEGGYALHGAYWHDTFGTPKSHGCVNLAPEDARRLFFWTEPQIPPGWQGVARSLTGTVVFIHP